MKAQYLPNHVFIGVFTYFGAAFTAVMGIQEKNSANSCGYDITLTEPDYNPASHYWNLYAGCRLSNGLGECFLASRTYITPCARARTAVNSAAFVQPRSSSAPPKRAAFCGILCYFGVQGLSWLHTRVGLTFSRPKGKDRVITPRAAVYCTLCSIPEGIRSTCALYFVRVGGGRSARHRRAGRKRVQRFTCIFLNFQANPRWVV